MKYWNDDYATRLQESEPFGGYRLREENPPQTGQQPATSQNNKPQEKKQQTNEQPVQNHFCFFIVNIKTNKVEKAGEIIGIEEKKITLKLFDDANNIKEEYSNPEGFNISNIKGIRKVNIPNATVRSLYIVEFSEDIKNMKQKLGIKSVTDKNKIKASFKDLEKNFNNENWANAIADTAIDAGLGARSGGPALQKTWY